MGDVGCAREREVLLLLVLREVGVADFDLGVVYVEVGRGSVDVVGEEAPEGVSVTDTRHSDNHTKDMIMLWLLCLSTKRKIGSKLTFPLPR